MHGLSLLLWLSSFQNTNIVQEMNAAGGEIRLVYRDASSREVYGTSVISAAKWESDLEDAWVLLEWGRLWPTEGRAGIRMTTGAVVELDRLIQHIDDEGLTDGERVRVLDRYGKILWSTGHTPTLSIGNGRVYAGGSQRVLLWPEYGSRD
jgi:hypothetical protein